jgi:hypothetical protein
MSKGKESTDLALVRPLQITSYLETLYRLGFPLETFMPTRRFACDNLAELQALALEICTHYSLGAKVKITVVAELTDNAAARIEYDCPSHLDATFANHVFPVKILSRVLGRGQDYLTYLMGHEIAHAYLHSRRVEGRDSELMTDVCSCMAGFLPYYDKVYGGKSPKTFKEVKEQQIANLIRGGDVYITPAEFLMVQYAVRGAYALQWAKRAVELFRKGA